MPKNIKVGAVSYLNTKPLVYRLDEIAPYADISYDLPSRLADQLTSGELDVALIPSVEYFQDASYEIVSNACIGCRGPVLSVKLLTRVPFDQINTLALDEGSRTSVALARILLQQRFGLKPRLESLPIGAGVDDSAADAILLIGDRAIHPPEGNFIDEWDLGDQWCRWSELSFVFAMWVSRPGVDTTALASAFEQARDEGTANLDRIASEEAAAVGLSESECLSYLRDNLYFTLGHREQNGLELFRHHAVVLGMAPADASCS
ncbi:MAG: menaquinone biosynthesis protein [Planctomycetes bacterium]|nr:menaquinone biosynthesis protein [Planctomycetota bacterium]